MDTIEQLIEHRKELVLAAEDVAPLVEASQKIAKTQLNHLIAVCGEASCAEEIANYLRYQGSRDKWELDAAIAVIRKMDDFLSATKISDDKVRVTAWRLYAVFLTRAFTYRREVSNKLKKSSAQTSPVKIGNPNKPQGHRP